MALEMTSHLAHINDAQYSAYPLFISSLSLHHFRNHAHTRLTLDASPVVLHGHNGAGKTNILEAISLLMPGRGLRGAKLVELGNLSPTSEPWAVAARMLGADGEVQIGTGKGRPTEAGTERREVHIDGQPANAQTDLARHSRILWLTPAMEQLFLESNSAGRKFLDRLVYHFDSEHAAHVNAYESAMRERNHLLEKGNWDEAWLSALEQTMAEKAGSIAASRLATLEKLNQAIGESHLSFPKPRLAASGVVENILLENKSALEAEDHFLALLSSTRKQDATAGRTLTGTHRSELIVTHRERGVPAGLCSTGEQKALLLSIILAQSRAGTRLNGIVPIVLFDEVVAHLDPVKRLELFEEICETRAQVWMTGTDASLFDGIKNRAQFFQVENGKVF